jgi:Bifunctional DNA primase/polymerase, N-terminal
VVDREQRLQHRAVPASKGCTVIDTDEKEGRQGGAHFDALCMKHTDKPAPATKVAQTVSNPPGHHRWYSGTVEWDGPAGLLGEGIDVKSHGYVVMPPSIIDGKTYAWSDTHERTDLPQFVADTLKAAHAARSKRRDKSHALKDANAAKSKRSDKSPLGGEHVSLPVFIDILSYRDPDDGRDQWRNDVASIHATPVAMPNEDGIGWQLLSDLERLDIAIRWSRGEYDRLGRFKDTPPSKYDGDGAVEAVFWSMPPKEGGIGFGSLVQQVRAAGYRGGGGE